MAPAGRISASAGAGQYWAWRLAGHGTTPQDLNETKWQDWYKAVSDGVYRLQAGCDRVSIVGLSMGGLLTIKLRLNYR